MPDKNEMRVFRNHLLFVAGDEIVEENGGDLFPEDVVVEILEKEDSVFAEKAGRPGDQEVLTLKMREVVPEGLGEMGDIFLDDF
jgi:hypothetical protein